jgi:hypothetical protein
LLQVDGVVNKGYSILQKGVDYSRIEKLGKSFGSARDTVTKQFKDTTAALQNRGISGSMKVVRERAFAVADEAVNMGKRGVHSLLLCLNIKKLFCPKKHNNVPRWEDACKES